MKTKKYILLMATVVAVFIESSVSATCYRDGLYPCAGGTGCDDGCLLCTCTPPAALGGPKCWYSDTQAFITRAAGGQTSGSVSICYSNFICTYTHTRWDCFGTSSSTVKNDSVAGSYSCGGPCGGGGA